MGKNPIAEGLLYKGVQETRQALKFASSQGLEVLHYNPVADTWQLTDGEIYSSALIEQCSK